MKRPIAVLHHVGDANDPPVRVESTLFYARAFPTSTIFVLAGKEADELKHALGHRVKVYHDAADTVGEVLAIRPVILAGAFRTHVTSTESGHALRAFLVAKILYAFTRVECVMWNEGRGSYRSPKLGVVRDVFRAIYHRIRLAFV